MAVCKYCECEMAGASPADSCVAEAITLYPGFVKIKEDFGQVRHGVGEAERCHDCNVAPGGFHHPGCDAERCPACNGQLISCGCTRPSREGA